MKSHQLLPIAKRLTEYLKPYCKQIDLELKDGRKGETSINITAVPKVRAGVNLLLKRIDHLLTRQSGTIKTPPNHNYKNLDLMWEGQTYKVNFFISEQTP